VRAYKFVPQLRGVVACAMGTIIAVPYSDPLAASLTSSPLVQSSKPIDKVLV
jgi:hypothetical protein